jgi:hypothetical protein
MENRNPTLKFNTIHASESIISDVSDVEEIQLECDNRKRFRDHKLKSIKTHLESSSPIRQRKKQNLLLYFINLTWPIILSCVNAWVMLDFTSDGETKGILNIVFAFTGFIFAVLSSLFLAPWQ